MVKYTDYLPDKNTRQRENVEWCIFYSFNAADEKSPRVLTIGDSICYQYKDLLREKLADKVNITSWATAKCTNDLTFLKDLEHILEYNRYDLITFNNGLHYLSCPTVFEEWYNAYCKTLEYIQAKLLGVPVSIVSNTPVNNAEKNPTVIMLNEAVRKIAAEFNMPLIDLYAEMDKLDRSLYWSDEFHFKEPAKEIQAQIMADHILTRLADVIANNDSELLQKSSLTGPDGAIK